MTYKEALEYAKAERDASDPNLDDRRTLEIIVELAEIGLKTLKRQNARKNKIAKSEPRGTKSNA